MNKKFAIVLVTFIIVIAIFSFMNYGERNLIENDILSQNTVPTENTEYESCIYRKKTADNLWENYYKEDADIQIYNKYTPYGLEGVPGDSTLTYMVETNYNQYKDKNATLEKYDEPIQFNIGLVHENTEFTSNQSIKDILKNQVGVMTGTNEIIKENDTFTVTGITIINGNDTTEEIWEIMLEQKQSKLL